MSMEWKRSFSSSSVKTLRYPFLRNKDALFAEHNDDGVSDASVLSSDIALPSEDLVGELKIRGCSAMQSTSSTTQKCPKCSRYLLCQKNEIIKKDNHEMNVFSGVD